MTRAAWSTGPVVSIPGLLDCSGCLSGTPGSPAPYDQRRRAMEEREGCDDADRTDGGLPRRLRTLPERAPRALPGMPLCGRRSPAAMPLRHNDISGTRQRGGLSLLVLGKLRCPLRRTRRHAGWRVPVLTLCGWGAGALCQGWQRTGGATEESARRTHEAAAPRCCATAKRRAGSKTQKRPLIRPSRAETAGGSLLRVPNRVTN